VVFWVGGPEKPVNMGANDLWFAPAVDTIPPTVPTGLASSNVASNSFSVSWTASTDNSGVAGYDVYLNGALTASVATPAATLTGLTASTTYSVTVKARDAVGNVSAASSALSVTTGASLGTPQHSIWGANPYQFAVTKNTGSPITVANSFYSYGTSPDVSAWRVVGARLWVPSGVTMTQAPTVRLWFGANTMISAAPDRTVTMSAPPTSGQWNEVFFPSAIDTNAGDQIWIGYEYSNGDYLGYNPAGANQGYIAALDGSHIVLTEDAAKRSQYMFDGSAATAASVFYGIDIIYDEGP
jgi:chitodextrinase